MHQPTHDRPGQRAEFEEAFAAIALGADELAARTLGYHVVMGASRHRERTRRYDSWSEPARELEGLEIDGLGLDNLNRQVVQGILHAFHTFCRVRDGAQITYLEQVAAYLELRDIMVPQREIDVLREQMAVQLEEIGKSGELASSMRAWEAERAVPPDELARTSEELFLPALEATIAAGVPVPDRIDARIIVHESPYYAYARYWGGYAGTVELATNLIWTKESVAHSICHEAFPGHLASGAAREQATTAGTWSPVTLPGLANTPISPVVEGLAECGAEILGWIRTPHDRLYASYNALQFAVRTNAAIHIHEYGEPAEPTVAYMVDQGAVSQEWATYHYGFITDPLWHTSFPHYWHGSRLVRRALSQFRGREPDLFQMLYGRPQTTSTLRDLIEQDGSQTAEPNAEG